MRIHLSVRRRAFTVLGNEVLRDRRLSFTARGILAYLLSLPDGAREDARTLADRNPGLGRRGVAKALDELVAAGYYVRRTTRDQHSGHLRTETYVFDRPHTEDQPLPAPAGTGGQTAGPPGTSPKGKKNPGKEPSRPRTPGAGPPSELHAPAAALLTRICANEPKLALSAADALALAPLTTPWLEHGIREPQIRSLLTAGLPPTVHSPRALLADRLVRKLPPSPARGDAAAPATPLPECTACRDPLPRAHPTGLCGSCSTTAAERTAHPLASGIAAVRAALRARPALAT